MTKAKRKKSEKAALLLIVGVAVWFEELEKRLRGSSGSEARNPKS